MTGTAARPFSEKQKCLAQCAFFPPLFFSPVFRHELLQKHSQIHTFLPSGRYFFVQF